MSQMNDAADVARAIDAEASALVATLPALPDDRLAALAATTSTLAARLDGEAARVATTLAELLGLYREGRVVFEGWAIVASAAHALARAIAEPTEGHAAALPAVRFELETLLPRTGAPAPKVGSPDVVVASLLRRP